MPIISDRTRAVCPSQKYNIEAIQKSPISELSGALGDLGTLLPILIALALNGSIALSSTLVFSGLANILTGTCFGIPLPVQPMKAIAAVALARNFSIERTVSAGLFVSVVIGVASATGILNWIGRVVPVPVVKGIQVGAGLSLVITAGTTLLQPLGWTKPFAGDNLLLASACFLLLLVTNIPATQRSDGLARIPAALLLLIVGLLISGLRARSSHHDHGPVGAVWHPYIVRPSAEDFRLGAIDAGLGQLPLTILNSIIAVTYLAADLLPSRPTPTPRALGLSILIMNSIGCIFGAMPTCHGSGGLAGQFRFGARSGSSVIMLGLFKLLLGLFINESWLLDTLGRFPKSFLAVMVISAGIELARVGETLNSDARDLWQDYPEDDSLHGAATRGRIHLDDKEKSNRWMVMMLTVAGLLAFKNDAVGFVLGLAWHWGLRSSMLFPWQSRIRLPETGRGGTAS